MKNLIVALNKARSEIPTIHKDGKSHHGKYATLDRIIEIVTPILSKHGLVIVQTFVEDQIVTTIWHESGENINSYLCLPVVDNKNKAQGLGISITYSRRYAIGALLNLALDDDTDGNQPRQVKPVKVNPLDALRSEIKKGVPIDDLILRWEKATLEPAVMDEGFAILESYK